jgi:hypothetical protein
VLKQPTNGPPSDEETPSEIGGEHGTVGKTRVKRRGGRVAGYAYLHGPKDARLFLNRVLNLLVAGDPKDVRYMRDLEAWYQLREPKGDPPLPPKLDPRVATAAANGVRAWLECGTAEVREKLDEIVETNQMLLKLLEQRGIDPKGGGSRNH